MQPCGSLRSQFNPAFAPLRGYVNIPVIGGMNINVGGNLAVDNILFSRDGKLVTLRSVSELLQARQFISAEVAKSASAAHSYPRHQLADFSD